MPQFFLTIDASALYSVDAPMLEILVNGAVVSSITINESFTTSIYNIDFSGTRPNEFSLRFSDSSGEAGRSITLKSVLISGQGVNTNLSLLTLNQNESSDLDITATDYLFGRIHPTNAEIGTLTIEGTNSNEVLEGTEGDDIIRAFSGNDRIMAGAGNDRIYGDAREDRLEGQNGNDVLYGGDGNDYILGGGGFDALNGVNII